MKLDQYEIKARIIPAVFSMIIPVIIFNHFFASDKLSDFLNNIQGIKILSNITISGVLLYFISQLGRVIGKGFFEKIFFTEELNMPTTQFLMFSDNTYSDQHKKRIRDKVYRDFGVRLPTSKEENMDEIGARIRIVETMAMIRKRLTENRFLLQHNIEYGAMRNAIGGAVVGLLFAFFNTVFFSYVVPSYTALYLSITLGAVYLIFILMSKYLISFYGRSYAKILFREYLTD